MLIVMAGQQLKSAKKLRYQLTDNALKLGKRCCS